MEANVNIPVFVMNERGEQRKIGTIRKTRMNMNSNRNINNINNKSFYEFNKYVLDYIKKDITQIRFNLAHEQTFNVFFIDENNIGIIFLKNSLKNGNIYYVFQKSSKNQRFLCYIVPNEKYFNYNVKDAITDITNELPFLLKKLEKLASIYQLFQSIPYNKNKVNQNFGINF